MANAGTGLSGANSLLLLIFVFLQFQFQSLILMAGEIIGAFKSLQTAVSISQMLLKAHVATEASADVIRLQRELFDAFDSLHALQAEHFSISEENRELKEELRLFKQFEVDSDNYRLKQIDSGVFAYICIKLNKPAATPHALCANCYSNSLKRILQITSDSMGDSYIRCAHCDFSSYLSSSVNTAMIFVP